MKRSARVRLVLLGSAVGLYACDNGSHDLFRQRYDSLEECRRDWSDPGDCKPVGPGNGASGGSGSWGNAGGAAGSAHGGYYVGPRYYWDSRSGGPIEVRPDGTTRSIGNAHSSADGAHFGGVRMGAGFVSRGGFGSSARAFGSGRG